MKKILIFAFSIVLISSLFSCSTANVKKGKISAFGQDENAENRFILLTCGEEEIIFIIGDKTVLDWQDKDSLAFLSQEGITPTVEYLSPGMIVSVTVGEKVNNEFAGDGFVAEKIVVNSVNFEHFTTAEG